MESKQGQSFRFIFQFFLLLIFVCSCQQGPLGPEDSFKRYIDMRFDGEKEKNKILEFLSGTFAEKVKNMTDLEYSSFVNMDLFEREDFKILSKKCENQSCFITYTLAYSTFDSKKKNKKQFFSETRKTATLVRDGDIWKIADIEHVKTFHDLLNPLQAFDDKDGSKGEGDERRRRTK